MKGKISAVAIAGSIVAYVLFDSSDTGKLATGQGVAQLNDQAHNNVVTRFYPDKESSSSTPEGHAEFMKFEHPHLTYNAEAPVSSGGLYSDRIDFEELGGFDYPRENIQNKEAAYLSEQMAAMTSFCPTCANILQHINLMSGNSLSESDLMAVSSGKNVTPELESIHLIYLRRAALSVMNDEVHKALMHYEQHVLGRLVQVDDMNELLSDPLYLDYQDYLIGSGLVKGLCTENPKLALCIERASALDK